MADRSPALNRFDDADSGLTFDCPAVAPSGAEVVIERGTDGERARVHLSTPDASEVYFELVRGPSDGPDSALAALRDDVGGRFADARFEDVEDVTIAGLAWRSCRFAFADRVRRVLAVELDGLVHRVILDPRSAVNEQILASLRRR